MFQGLGPFPSLFVLLLLEGAALHKRIAQVVFGLATQRLVLASEHLAESLERLVVITLLVRRCPLVKLQSVRARVTLHLLLKHVVRVLVILLVVELQALIRRPSA